MSLETALDDERREVMKILEGRPSQARALVNRSSSPFAQNGRTRSPAPPVRSMLDIAGPASPKPAPGATPAFGSTSQAVRSMLDTSSPGPTRGTQSVMTSASAAPPSGSALHKARSDATESRPRATTDRETVDLNADYQFSMLPSIQNQALPKRVTQGGRKNISAMASIMQGQELGPLPRGRDRGRHNSTAGIGASSKSPSSRLLHRSESPGTGTLMQTPGKFITETGKVIDMNNAYRRLSDAALLKSGGELSTLPANSASSRNRLATGEVLSPTGEVRLQKDYYQNGEGEEDALETSDDELQTGSSADEAWGQGSTRGRKRDRRRKGLDEGDSNADDSEGDAGSIGEGPVGLGRAARPRKAKSLLAAAEEERIRISSRPQYRSLLEPTVTVTGPAGEKLSSKRSEVHPNTNYDHSVSTGGSPVNSDSEELGDIRHAQSLNISSSPVDSSIPHRVMRTILRGDFAKMQREAEEGSRRLRTYLVATDLSAESAYALEWTIGTVLRDGDTLMAVYAVDEEVGTGKGGDTESIHSLSVGEGAKSIQDTAAVIEKMTLAAQMSPLGLAGPSPSSASSLTPRSRKDSSAGSTDSRYMTKAEQERLHAIEGISQTCIKFLRKTKLQVRIAVEVIHCRSPKYMITEAIDGLEPTLVVLGSRGRSALKGVLLGSFSNYLVTKSSVPVMVVRRRLSGRKSENHPNIRLANNLTPTKPMPLEQAKVD